MGKFKCNVCNYVHEGANAPEVCPVCQAPALKFVAEGGKKGLNKNSNVYTLIYMVVMVAIVSLVLSITSGSLKSTQAKNIKLDKMKQILSSTPEYEAALAEGADAEELFAEGIVKFDILNAEGQVEKELDPVADFDYKVAEGEYALYTAQVAGVTKYILPMNGAGLWGAIWGYVALNDDRNTIHGIYFNHASETAGLGAEIITTKFRAPFIGKKILDAKGDFMSIFIAKTGQKSPTGQEQVDNLSGATVTCKGVETMIESSLSQYSIFFKSGSREMKTEVGTVIVANDGKSATIIHDKEHTDTLVIGRSGEENDTLILEKGGNK